MEDQMSKISDELRAAANLTLKYGSDDYNRIHNLADRIDAEMVELPRGKDGRPIHLGETVYGEGGMAWHVEGVVIGRWTEYADSPVVYATDDSGQWRNLLPWLLTHERPDSLERIADEIEKADVDGCIDWADRIRKLAKERKHES